MQEEGKDPNVDSDTEFERPKDEYMFYYKAFKLEEKKMINHQRFDEVATKYWQLLRNTPLCNINQPTISQELYTEFMRRIYKVLLPLYRDDEMKSEISQEWLMDSRGQPELTYNLFIKLLFRIAHQWATNIDLDEYLELLNRLYQRIIMRRVYYPPSGNSCFEYPQFWVSFPEDEKKIKESGAAVEKQAKYDEWLECKSNETEKSEYQYEYREDQDNMITKKYKKQKQNFNAMGGGDSIPLTIKEPFIYTEETKFSWSDNLSSENIVVDYLIDLQYCFPLGYITEQYLISIKQNVHELIDQIRNQRKAEQTSTLNFGNFNSNEAYIEDPGFVEERGEINTNYINVLWDQTNSEYAAISGIAFTSSITDILINNYRRLLRDGSILTLRLYSQFPKPGAKSKNRSALNNEPITEINKFGSNPAFDRRVQFKLFDQAFINIHYMIQLPQYEIVYRSDVNRIEGKGKLAIKDQDDMKKDEEFGHVETTYKKMRQVMLSKKFGSIYTDRLNSDIKEQRRLKKLIEREEQRRESVQKQVNLVEKNLTESYEEKSLIKMMRGPFYALESKEGLREDNFVTTSEYDLIEAARTKALRILIIGKPRSGKTTLARNLAQKLDLVHINIEIWIQALLEKIKNYEAPDVEEGEEPPKFLSDLEEQIMTQLKQGGGPSDSQIVDIYTTLIQSPLSRMKGYILDLSFYQRDQPWSATIKSQHMLGLIASTNENETFSHIIELLCDDEEVRLRAQNMRVNPETGNVYSRWEREERKKPLPEPGEDEPELTDEQIEAAKPFDELSLIHRSNDTDNQLNDELAYYNTVERTGLEELSTQLYDNQYIKIDIAGLKPDELTEAVGIKLKFDDGSQPLRPIATIIEGGSDFKSLLTEGIEEGFQARKWSLWKQIDPVALSQGKVIQGSPEYAVSYYNNAFVFANEENQKRFLEEPKIFIDGYAPQMPSNYRVLMLGPKGVGKHTQAQLLSDLTGWRVVDFPALIQSKIAELVKPSEFHTPNNPIQGGRIALSEQELTDIIEGKQFPAWKFIPWLLDHLGYQLEKKRPPPPEVLEDGQAPADDEEEIDEDVKKKKELEAKKKRDEEDKKRKEEEEIQRQKEERRKRRSDAREQGLDLVELGLEESEEEPIIIDDLSIDDLVLKQDEVTGRTPFVGGFILIGFPETQEHIDKLKEHTIEFDSVIYLTDTNEEEPGLEIKKRMKDDEMYDWEFENENSQRILTLIKQYLSDQGRDDIVKEISCNGLEADVLIRIRNEIDPFYLKIDNPDDNRQSADLGEEDRRLPKGDFGDYCPVTYVKDHWIVRGNPEQEVTIFGKTYWLSGEKEAEEFKFNPTRFLVTKDDRAILPLQPPHPKIMILGHKGAGVSTQIRLLCEKYKLDEFNLKDEYLAKLKQEKDKRKRRRLLDRGFKPPQPIEEEGGEPIPDPEIEDDPEDFDKESHERQVMKLIYEPAIQTNKGLVIDGTWTDFNPEESGIGQSLQDLLFESRRVPEIVIILKCKEDNTFKRTIDEEATRKEFDRLTAIRTENRKKQREEDRDTKLKDLQADEEKTLEEIEEQMAQWDEERDGQEEAEDENDPEKPNFEEMMEKQKEDLRQRREKDEAFVEEFSQAMKDKNVFVIDDIKTDISADYVFIKLLDRIKDNFQKRQDLIEKQQAQQLKPEEVPFYEKSYIYKHSRFGINSPMSQGNPIKTKQNAVLYRERLYFLSTPEQQDAFVKEPSKFTSSTVESVPQDIIIKPRICVVGIPKSGKSTLCTTLSKTIGVVHLKMSKIIELFAHKERDSVQSDLLRRITRLEGRSLDDEFLVNLLVKRLQFKDCQLNGWVLEDFPKTRAQAQLLSKKGIVPYNVFIMRSEIANSYDRTTDKQETRFGANRVILGSRIKFYQNNLPSVISFYQKQYTNVCEIDTSKSKWSMEDISLSEIGNSLEARQNFARDYYLRDKLARGCKMRSMHMDRSLNKQSLSEFRYYCPVSWKNEKLLIKCNEDTEDCVLYKNFFYYFKSSKERDMFLSNPPRFLLSTSFPKRDELPLRLMPHKAAEILSVDKALNNHCSVTLVDEERVTKGDPMLLIAYKELKYTFDTEFKLQRFNKNPFKYFKGQLPVKMPPTQDKVSLYNLQKMEDSISFMEQALGQIVTKGLREVSENRLKYPTISVKETMLKLFALYLKTENTANTEYMKTKYSEKMKQFIERCELPEELFDLAQEKEQKKSNNQWAEFKEKYYNELGAKYDHTIMTVNQEKVEGFANYIR